MMKRQTRIGLVVLTVGAVAMAVFSQDDGGGEETKGRSALEQPPDLLGIGTAITFAKDVHFLSGEEMVRVAAGTYKLEKGNTERLRLVSATGDAIVIAAVSTPHKLNIAEPAALSSAKEPGDRVEIALFLKGSSLSAIGSFSGARSRAGESGGFVISGKNVWWTHRVTSIADRRSTYGTAHYMTVELEMPSGDSFVRHTVSFFPDDASLPKTPYVTKFGVAWYYPMSHFSRFMKMLTCEGNLGCTIITFENGESTGTFCTQNLSTEVGYSGARTFLNE